eukprot:jgi/Tetstr1/432602/TSEL_021972.t1
MPPVGLANPGLWNPRNDDWDRYLIDEKKHATRDEYRHLLCYGVFTAAAHAAPTDAVATLRANNATARDTADANDLLDSAIRTIATNGVDGLLNALDDKKLEVSLHQAAKAQTAAQFKGSGSGGSGGGSGNIRIKEQERASEHADRATKERAHKNKDKDKIKGKPQPGNPARKTTTPQTEEQNCRMQDATPAQLTFLEGELARFVESGAWELGTCRKWPTRSKRYLRRTMWRGARILPYVDDFLLFSASMEQALHLRQRLASLLDAWGLQRNPTKGFWEPCQFGRHMGVDIDSASGMLYAPADKLNRLSRQATRLIGRATRNARWLPLRELLSLAGQAQYLFLAIPAARFILRELHSVVGDRWGGRVRMTPQLRRDLQWWTSVPSQANGKPIHRPVETAYLHTDSSGYGWGGVLNGRLEARGFWSSADERQNIT